MTFVLGPASTGLTLQPGSDEELARFEELQRTFPEMYERVFQDPKAERTVIVIPSLSLDPDELEKIAGVIHYEERLLCLLMLLRMPRTQLIYVTSLPVEDAVIDYYLHLLPGVPSAHARARLEMISIDDAAVTSLSQKILDRPDILDRIRRSIQHPTAAHLSCFNSTAAERSLAVRLGVPMYAADPMLSHLGSKSMSRSLMRDVGLTVPDGFEQLRDRGDVVDALLALHQQHTGLEHALVKLDEGFSGEGNAVLSLSGVEDAVDARAEINRRLDSELRCVAPGEDCQSFLEKLATMGGVVEVMVEGPRKRSPSVQMRIDPTGRLQLVSTHDQVLGGSDGQVFEGCTFPARRPYRVDLHEAGFLVGAELRDRGVIGRFGIDFVSVQHDGQWVHNAIEINLRKGGTTLPYLMLEFLTNGTYDSETGRFRTPTGATRGYYATDNLVDPRYLGLTPAELIDMAVVNDLHFDAASQEGTVFHLLGAVTDYGKVGMLSIAKNRRAAIKRHQGAVAALTREAKARAR